MSRKRTINVRTGFCKYVCFEVDFWKEDKAAEIDEVLKEWTRITGLNFSGMSRKDHSGDVMPENEGFRVVVVKSPLDNRPETQFSWEV